MWPQIKDKSNCLVPHVKFKKRNELMFRVSKFSISIVGIFKIMDAMVKYQFAEVCQNVGTNECWKDKRWFCLQGKQLK